MQNKPSQTVLLTAFFAVVFFFGSSWLGNKIVLDQGIPPFYGAAGRFSIAAVFLLFLRFIIPTKHKLTREHVIVILMYGLIMIGLVNAMTFWGMQFITSSLSSIIFSVYPIIIMVLSHI